ncbi:MAG: cellulase family glycosylhydrolase [Verrucomicrobia bacterium]|nr:cellulase family glycosylhydrolase [Verrucomicrobiota bacterium]
MRAEASRSNLTKREFLRRTAVSAMGLGLAGPLRAAGVGTRTNNGAPVSRYGRWQKEFPPEKQVTRVEFTGPDGKVETRPAFLHQPAKLVYDHQGFETIEPQGVQVTAVRFTPVQLGRYRWQALAGEEVVDRGAFRSEASHDPGYVRISSRDPRYFAFSNGDPYCAIGLNLCSPAGQREGGASGAGGERRTGTYGAESYRQRFEQLSKNGCNFCRLWLSNGYFNAQTEVAGELNLANFAHLDAVVELARRYGIKLKVCLESARNPSGQSFPFGIKSPADGQPPASMDAWFQGAEWQNWWWRKLSAYLARYGDDPAIIAWELWNEINCCHTTNWSVQREWTRQTLPLIKRQAPRNLVTNSIGSFDDEKFQSWYDDFKMEEMDFQQVHRYLDNGAPWSICHLEPPLFSADAVQRTRRPDRPVILAETGAVRDRHSARFPFYEQDKRGIVCHDCSYPAFFAGAAGTGHMWFWSYIERNNLWGGYKPLADLLTGVELDGEKFRPIDLSNESIWFYALLGKKHLLAWARNRADSWYRVLQDQEEPEAVKEQKLTLPQLGTLSGAMATTTIWPWNDGTAQAKITHGSLQLPSFHCGLLVKARLS